MCADPSLSFTDALKFAEAINPGEKSHETPNSMTVEDSLGAEFPSEEKIETHLKSRMMSVVKLYMKKKRGKEKRAGAP